MVPCLHVSVYKDRWVPRNTRGQRPDYPLLVGIFTHIPSLTVLQCSTHGRVGLSFWQFMITHCPTRYHLFMSMVQSSRPNNYSSGQCVVSDLLRTPYHIDCRESNPRPSGQHSTESPVLSTSLTRTTMVAVLIHGGAFHPQISCLIIQHCCCKWLNASPLHDASQNESD